MGRACAKGGLAPDPRGPHPRASEVRPGPLQPALGLSLPCLPCPTPCLCPRCLGTPASPCSHLPCSESYSAKLLPAHPLLILSTRGIRLSDGRLDLRTSSEHQTQPAGRGGRVPQRGPLPVPKLRAGQREGCGPGPGLPGGVLSPPSTQAHGTALLPHGGSGPPYTATHRHAPHEPAAAWFSTRGNLDLPKAQV